MLRLRTPLHWWSTPAALAAAILLSACASVREPPPPTPSQTQVPRVWTLEGRIGVRMEDQGWQARLRWQQQGDDFHARLSGPLGSGAVDLRMADGVLRVRDSRGGDRSGTEVDLWARETFGEPLPVEELRFWLLGRASPDVPAQVEGGVGELPRGLSQAGWRVHFDEWARFEGRTLPRRLSIERGGVRVKLVVHRWEPGVGAGG